LTTLTTFDFSLLLTIFDYFCLGKNKVLTLTTLTTFDYFGLLLDYFGLFLTIFDSFDSLTVCEAEILDQFDSLTVWQFAMPKYLNSLAVWQFWYFWQFAMLKYLTSLAVCLAEVLSNFCSCLNITPTFRKLKSFGYFQFCRVFKSFLHWLLNYNKKKNNFINYNVLQI